MIKLIGQYSNYSMLVFEIVLCLFLILLLVALLYRSTPRGFLIDKNFVETKVLKEGQGKFNSKLRLKLSPNKVIELSEFDKETLSLVKRKLDDALSISDIVDEEIINKWTQYPLHIIRDNDERKYYIMYKGIRVLPYNMLQEIWVPTELKELMVEDLKEVYSKCALPKDKVITMEDCDEDNNISDSYLRAYITENIKDNKVLENENLIGKNSIELMNIIDNFKGEVDYKQHVIEFQGHYFDLEHTSVLRRPELDDLL